MDLVNLSILSVASFFAALIGSMSGSGGLITIPLMILFGMSPHSAIATTRFASLFFQGSAMTNFYKHRILKPREITHSAFFALVGSVLGAMLLLKVPADALEHIIGIIIITMIILILVNSELGHLLHRHISLKKYPVIKYVVLPLIFFTIGIYTGFFGGGAGTLSIFTFMLFREFSSLHATASTRMIILSMTPLPLIVFILSGLVDFRIGITVGIAFAFGAWTGSSVAMKIGSKKLNWVLVVVGLLLAAKMLFF